MADRTLRPLPNPFEKYRGSVATPISGRIYVSTSLKFALIYALGGDVAGYGIAGRPSDHLLSDIKNNGRYGCLFEVTVSPGADIVIDEDELGQLAAGGKIKWLENVAREIADFDLWYMAQQGEYDAWIRLGHLLHDHLNESEMRKLLPHAMSFAVKGPVHVVKGYRIDKLLAPEMGGSAASIIKISEPLMAGQGWKANWR
jgi:hypothetical protein